MYAIVVRCAQAGAGLPATTCTHARALDPAAAAAGSAGGPPGRHLEIWARPRRRGITNPARASHHAGARQHLPRARRPAGRTPVSTHRPWAEAIDVVRVFPRFRRIGM